ncbi:MAG: transcriptional repressor [Odoribacter sp.]|nr:transcriptional repressor [Odoribacter sp.]
MNLDPIRIMEQADIKPTSNRLLVLKTLLSAKHPLSLIEIETWLHTLERSSILRVLTLFHEHDIVHTVEDGRGITKYEVCHGDLHCSINDMHPHFYCEKCNKVFCFEDISIPDIPIPEEFQTRTVNFMLKGICPQCQKQPKN